jgi:hypothetical protein
MTRTFGQELYQFAKTVDIVTESTYEAFRSEAQHYLESTFSCYSIGFLVGTRVSGERGLRTEWYTIGEDWADELRKNGAYYGQVAIAFDKERTFWIKACDGGPLNRTKEYVDLYGYEGRDIPPFAHNHTKDIYTSIIRPMYQAGRQDGRAFGVLNLESTVHLDFNPTTRTEIEKLVDAWAILYSLKVNNELVTTNTAEAWKQLVRERPAPVATSPPTIFIASSGKAPKDVTDAILDVVKQFPELRPEFWGASTTPGDITAEVFSKVTSCRIGICYLSEPDTLGSYKYRDNANVLFEAGMMESLKHISSQQFTEWIPVREQESPPAEFDFRQLRMLIVERTPKGKLIAKQFKETLAKMIRPGV